ncbi:MAG: dihydrofolate reductase family protein, partial [Gammaproteobacteria bacterium]|nr:dihydrofolate reductase family protein [Gammaproteobacteria bacterium]
RWITGKTARRHSHKLRAQVDAVLVGIGTVLADDPVLSVRHVKSNGLQPLRIIIDSKLKIPLTSRVLDVSSGQQTMVVTTRQAPAGKLRELENLWIRTMIADIGDDEKINLQSLMNLLGNSGITSILIEGGSEINASALRGKIVDKVVIFYSARIIGGRDSIGIAGGYSPKSLDDSVFLKDVSVRRLGEDIMVEGYVR